MSFTIKSWDEFNSPEPRKRAKPAKIQVNEGLFNKNKSKDVMVVGNKKHKAVWRDKGGGNHILKIVNDLDVITNDRLTDSGQYSVTTYLNGQPGFSPKWDPLFFKDNFIVYTVKRDNARVQKIAFTNTVRAGAEGVDASINFISTEEYNGAKDQSGILNEPEPEEPVVTDDTDVITTDPDTVITDKFEGSKFKYMFNTIQQVAIFECMRNGSLHYESMTNPDVTGTVHYVNGKIILMQDSLDNGATTPEAKEVTDAGDVAFFKRVFTDEAFLKSLIDAYENENAVEEFDGIFTVENIRKHLYDDNKYLFFPRS